MAHVGAPLSSIRIRGSSRSSATRRIDTGSAKPVPASSKSGGIRFMLSVAGQRQLHFVIQPRRGTFGRTFATAAKMSTPAAPVVAGSLVVAWAATAVMVAWGTVVAASASVPMAETPGRTMVHPAVQRQRCRRLARLRRWHSGDGEAGIGGTILVQSGSSVTLEGRSPSTAIRSLPAARSFQGSSPTSQLGRQRRACGS
jgi:hypothetical protein